MATASYEHIWPKTTKKEKVANLQHPDASVLERERLIKDVYEALRKSPTVVVSPWIAKNTIVKSQLSSSETPTVTSCFGSTSIMATANILLGISDAPPLGDRMAWANTL